MILFFTVTLVLSLVGMVVLLGIKRWELSTGRVFGAAARPAAGAFFSRGLDWVEHQMPNLIARRLHRARLIARVVFHRAVAAGLILVERLLERVLHMLRQGTQAKKPGEGSSFLREVAEHKQKILRAPPQDFEELD